MNNHRYSSTELASKVVKAVVHFKSMEKINSGSGMLREVQDQYASMAAGGDGGMAHYVGRATDWDHDGEPTAWTSIRENNYPDYPDEYFQEVCDLLGWDR